MFIAIRRMFWFGAALVLITGVTVNAQENPGAAGSAIAPSVATHIGPDSLYPDPTLTPGAAFDGVTADQICTPGYARSVRDVTSTERAQVYAEYGLVDVPGADEVDHYILLELGGSNDITNLWPEPYMVPGAHEKDRVEHYLHEQVCSGALMLADAQQMIISDWYAVYLSLSPPSADTTGGPATQPTADAPNGTPAPISAQGVMFTSVTGGPPGGRASAILQTHTRGYVLCAVRHARGDQEHRTGSRCRSFEDGRIRRERGLELGDWTVDQTRSRYGHGHLLHGHGDGVNHDWVVAGVRPVRKTRRSRAG